MNKVKSIRTKLGLTQRQLADKVGTSQQQIQRIESGRISARLTLAAEVATALGKPLNVVFPGSLGAIAKAVEGIDTSRHLPSDVELSRIQETGVELDSSEHCLKVWLRGHGEAIYFPLSPEEKRRLFQGVQGEMADSELTSFVVFESWDKRIAINLAELAACQFLSVPMVGVNEPDSSAVSEPLDKDHVFVFPKGASAPIKFKPEVDRAAGDEDAMGDFDNIFFQLEMNPAPSERLHFQDVDGESVFLRAGSVALLSVPLWVMNPVELDSIGTDDQLDD